MAKPKLDLILSGSGELLTCLPAPNNRAGRLSGAALGICGERIKVIAPLAELEQEWDTSQARVLDLGGMIAAPGFVDAHTHLVFGGSRAAEYAARMTRSQQETAALGIPTGIQATVTMTRQSSPYELLEHARRTLERMFRYGTTTVESKSGYGLSLEKELELLEVNRALQGKQPVDIVSTFLGAHDFPQEIPRQSYLDCLVNEMIPQAAEAGLAKFCDVYCDEGYYSLEESQRILQAGQRYGLQTKIHTDAYANIGGAGLAADLKAVSADHLNYTTPGEMRRLAEAGVVGVVMPGLDFAVRHPRPFDARRMLAEGMQLALATDFCPGCWLESMQLVMQLACRLYAFSLEEALLAATSGAAQACGLLDRGVLAPGKLADIQIWNLPSFEDLVYRLGNNAVKMVIKRGRVYSF
jgi:imidazolonepropionase